MLVFQEIVAKTPSWGLPQGVGLLGGGGEPGHVGAIFCSWVLLEFFWVLLLIFFDFLSISNGFGEDFGRVLEDFGRVLTRFFDYFSHFYRKSRFCKK